MSSELEKLKKKIFFGDHSNDEWEKIKVETENAIKNAKAEDVQEFVDCGAYSLLEQVIEYL